MRALKSLLTNVFFISWVIAVSAFVVDHILFKRGGERFNASDGRVLAVLMKNGCDTWDITQLDQLYDVFAAPLRDSTLPTTEFRRWLYTSSGSPCEWSKDGRKRYSESRMAHQKKINSLPATGTGSPGP